MHFELIAQFIFNFVEIIHIFINDRKIIYIHDDVNFFVFADEHVVIKINEIKV